MQEDVSSCGIVLELAEERLERTNGPMDVSDDDQSPFRVCEREYLWSDGYEVPDVGV